MVPHKCILQATPHMAGISHQVSAINGILFSVYLIEKIVKWKMKIPNGNKSFKSSPFFRFTISHLSLPSILLVPFRSDYISCTPSENNINEILPYLPEAERVFIMFVYLGLKVSKVKKAIRSYFMWLQEWFLYSSTIRLFVNSCTIVSGLLKFWNCK